jgi:hypothetical protein
MRPFKILPKFLGNNVVTARHTIEKRKYALKMGPML